MDAAIFIPLNQYFRNIFNLNEINLENFPLKL